MSRQYAALLQQYLKLLIVPAVTSASLLIMGPWLLVTMFGMTAHSLSDFDAPQAFFLSYAGVALFALMTSAWSGVPQLVPRSRQLPLPTLHLALFYSIVPAVAVAILNGFTLWSYNVIFNTAWPIVTTSAWFGVTSALLSATLLWLRDCRLHRTGAAMLCLAAWLWWIAEHYFPNGFREPLVLWHHLSVVDVVVLTSILGMAMSIVVRESHKYRQGMAKRGWLLILLEANPMDAVRSQPGASLLTPFPSARTAFAVSSWRRSRFVLLVMHGLFGLLFVWLTIGTIQDGNGRLEGLFILFPVFCGLLGFANASFQQSLGWHKQDGSLSAMIATLPVSDAALGRMLIWSWIRPMISVPVTLLASIVLGILIHGLWFGFPDYKSLYLGMGIVQATGPWIGLLLLMLAPLLTWTAGGLIGVVIAAGQIRRALLFTGLGFLMIVVAGLLIRSLGPGTFQDRLGLFVLLTLTVGVVGGGTAWLFRSASQRQLVTRWQVVFSFAVLWVVIGLIWVLTPFGAEARWMLSGISALVAMPIAGTPLAVQLNRHR